MSMEKLKCPVCSHYALCSIGGEITDTQARTCKAYSYIPTPSAPRPIHSPVDHYDVDVNTGTISFHVVQTNDDRIRSMTDEELADLYMKAIEDEEYPGWWGNKMGLLAWLKSEVPNG